MITASLQSSAVRAINHGKANESEELLRKILINEGITDEEVLLNTPRRWVQALRQQLDFSDSGFEFTTFPSESSNMVIVDHIQFSSVCAHHLLPFYGHAHVGYIPQGSIVGLSKLARTVRAFSLGLWAQEELTQAIMQNLQDSLDPLGVAVVMQAEHTCMSVRGVKAPGSKTTTSSMSGVFLEDGNNARSEFLSLIT